MDKIKKFHINFTKNIEIPFFQVSPQLRVRFGVELFDNGKLSLLKDILSETLDHPQEINVTFISGYIKNDRRYREKTNIGKYIKIKNWSETITYHDEIDANVIFTTIKNIRFEEVYQYIKSVVKGMRSSYIVIYNENYLVYISEDVIDFISYDQNLIQNLKNHYQELYDTYYEK